MSSAFSPRYFGFFCRILVSDYVQIFLQKERYLIERLLFSSRRVSLSSLG